MQEAWDVVEEQPTVADLWAEYDRIVRLISDLDDEIDMKYAHLRELKDDAREIRDRIDALQGEIDWGNND